jgi:hypothetical protein
MNLIGQKCPLGFFIIWRKLIMIMSIEQRTVYTSYGKDFETLEGAEAYAKIMDLASALDGYMNLEYENNWYDVLIKLREVGFDVVNTLEDEL